MTGYKLATIRAGEDTRAAVIIGDRAYDAVALTGDARYVSVQNILTDWDRAHAQLAAASVDPAGESVAVAEAVFEAPIPRPNILYCAGANYRDHAEEMAHLAGKPPEDPRAAGARPWFFLKSPHTVVPSGACLHVTGYGRNIDWEAELVAVIGRTARNVTVDQALSFVAGYTCGNDLSARDQGFRLALHDASPFRADWTRHKSFDDACPLGPWIVPADYVSDPMDLSVRLWVDDELMQDSNTGKMIFSIAEQIAFLSEGITLHPGDLIMTGTPAGVGASRQQFLRSGNIVRLEIGEIGTLHNAVA